jgi:hypothetical protein
VLDVQAQRSLAAEGIDVMGPLRADRTRLST